jgi:hypothetical protein
MRAQIGFRFEARSKNGVVDTYKGDRIDERMHERAKYPGQSRSKGGTAYLLWFGTKLTAVENDRGRRG